MDCSCDRSSLKASQRECEAKETALKDKLGRAQHRIDLMLLARQKEETGGGVLGVTDATRSVAAPGNPKPKVDVLASHLVEGAPPE